MSRSTNNQKIPRADLVFEISWEVCNRVGGINTVLATKAMQMVKRYHNGYFLVGPWLASANSRDFEEAEPAGEMKTVLDRLKSAGITCHFGHWLIEGNPNAVLIDFKSLWPQINSFKWQLWDSFKVDSLNSAFEFDEPVVWGYGVAKFLQAAAAEFGGKKIVAHFHEWLAGAGLLFSKKLETGLPTVFTTHATTLGRTLAFNSVDFYASLESIKPDEEAKARGVAAKHGLEKACAQNCTILTTVSEITGVECQYFLGRIPDIFLPNGLDMAKYPSFEEVSLKHHFQRARIREYLFYHFFPYYTFDVKTTLFYFMMARYEFRAKGIDIFIKSLGNLNAKLKGEKSKKTIVVFLWIPTLTKGLKPDLAQSRSDYFDIKHFVEENSGDLVENFMYSLVNGTPLKQSDVFENEPSRTLERKLAKLKRTGLPTICTHELQTNRDAILDALYDARLTNSPDDRVKVVLYPTYLGEDDKLLNLSIQEALQGCHLGVFPSYYEPWGLTPLEAAAEGVSAITSDLSGVGRFLKQLPLDPKYPGIYILNRFETSDSKTIEQLTTMLYQYSMLTRKERVENKINARKLADSCDWKDLADNYVKAHNAALAQCRQNPKK